MASTQKKSESSLQPPVKPSTSKEKPTPKASSSQNPDAPVTKRLHISGLTPAITLDDLNRRLSTFGSVEAVDGMGKVDAVGRPRSFAYVTLNTNVGKLSRCEYNGLLWLPDTALMALAGWKEGADTQMFYFVKV
jgi:hypothetical protein